MATRSWLQDWVVDVSILSDRKIEFQEFLGVGEERGFWRKGYGDGARIGNVHVDVHASLFST